MTRFLKLLAVAALSIPSAFARLGENAEFGSATEAVEEDGAFWSRTLQMSMSMPVATTPDIPGTAIAAGGFDTLVAALSAADLVGALSEPNGPFTVFAPTNDAFAALPEGLVGCLLEDTAVLSSILLYHVASGKALSTDLSDGQEITTLNGASVIVDLSDGVKINSSTVIAADVEASNGVIHVIDSVLVPPGLDVAGFLEICLTPTEAPLPDIPGVAINAGVFNTLVAALTATDLVPAISEPEGPFTVFAPTDDAFAALPEGLVGCLLEDTDSLTAILLYHVVAEAAVFSTALTDGQEIETLLGPIVTVDLSDGVKINTSTVINADVEASNGVIHVIDSVLVPPGLDVAAYLEACLAPEPTDAPIAPEPTEAPIAPEPTDAPLLDIPGTAIAVGGFNTLVAALSATDLVPAISEPNGPFTVFAPTDDAFAALPDGLVGCLLEDTAVLSSILLYHVVGGSAVFSTDLLDGDSVVTLNGASVTVDLSDGVKINMSTVIIPDVEASNGVIHVIDAVLVPPGLDVAGFLEACLAPDSEVPTDAPIPDIIGVAVGAAPEFSTLVTAVTNNNLVEALSEPNGPYTVFAPTEAVFETLPLFLVECLVSPELSELLTPILLYHVVPRELASADLRDGQTVTTLNGAEVAVTINDEGIFINDGQVVLPDIQASNGIIHGINTLLTPPGLDLESLAPDLLTSCTPTAARP